MLEHPHVLFFHYVQMHNPAELTILEFSKISTFLWVPFDALIGRAVFDLTYLIFMIICTITFKLAKASLVILANDPLHS